MGSENNDETENRKKQTRDRLIKIGLKKFCSDPIAWFTLALVVSNGLLWWEAYRTGNTLVANQRAWVAARDIQPLPEEWKSSAYVELRQEYENVGRLPATNMHWVVRSGTLEKDNFRKPPIVEAIIRDLLDGKHCQDRTASRSKLAIFPGTKDVHLLPFREEQLNKVRAGTHFPLVVGCFVYKISDGTTHRTQFCNIMEHVKEAPHWRTTMCITGNWGD